MPCRYTERQKGLIGAAMTEEDFLEEATAHTQHLSVHESTQKGGATLAYTQDPMATTCQHTQPSCSCVRIPRHGGHSASGATSLRSTPTETGLPGSPSWASPGNIPEPLIAVTPTCTPPGPGHYHPQRPLWLHKPHPGRLQLPRHGTHRRWSHAGWHWEDMHPAADMFSSRLMAEGGEHTVHLHPTFSQSCEV